MQSSWCAKANSAASGRYARGIRDLRPMAACRQPSGEDGPVAGQGMAAVHDGTNADQRLAHQQCKRHQKGGSAVVGRSEIAAHKCAGNQAPAVSHHKERQFERE